jgi:uncharacterized protein YjbI with pentapeptide repeats
LAGAVRFGATLYGATLRGATLDGASLLGANLVYANLSGDNLLGAYLVDASLRGASLAAANLADANLYGANLLWANLRGADLSRANLADANLVDAILYGANLDAPIVPDLDRKILEQIESDPESFDMSSWHNSCGTAHCEAGWAVVMAGDAGRELEKEIGTANAGTLIFAKSCGYVPNFYASNDEALADLRARCGR